uniref:Uncharacterized protein n=1 Tax=Brassica oleracea TaxID=3712 RepID=A0A3P6CG03_BRAOL|nr:unnamed protein product [Brassica oleracea]
MVAGARVCGVPDGIRSTVIHLPSHLSAAVLKEKCKIDLCLMRITGSRESTYQDGVNLCKKRESQLMLIHQAVTTTGCCCCEEFMWSLRPMTYQLVTLFPVNAESKDQRSLKKTVHISSMKDDGGEQYLRLPTAVVVVVTAKTYHKMLFMF